MPSPTLPGRYRAMALTRPGGAVLQPLERELALPGPGQVLLRVHMCGVCRTDLHVVDGDLPLAERPRVPGHEVVGTVVAAGAGSTRFAPGTRVGVPWLHDTCGTCRWCGSERENLCEQARFTGWTVDGGYAEYLSADERFCFALPPGYSDEQAAPLLCAGLIGWRALGMAGESRTLGLYGFGAAGHLVAQVALQQGRQVYAFTRPGDSAAQALARTLGVHWAGGSDEAPPTATDGALIFAPVGSLVPVALAHSEPGSTIVCAGIHMSDIPPMPYSLLWKERVVRSVANLTRADGESFFAWAAAHHIESTTERFALADANEALARLRDGRLTGAAVLDCRA
ncbi:MAG: zinc-dependent alcohol dehydrogenase family protein [Rubrivivax sp.]|nr:zinc-dependent alcohol dehydrogenase family protein [Rubrivivax sp.]